MGRCDRLARREHTPPPSKGVLQPSVCLSCQGCLTEAPASVKSIHAHTCARLCAQEDVAFEGLPDDTKADELRLPDGPLGVPRTAMFTLRNQVCACVCASIMYVCACVCMCVCNCVRVLVCAHTWVCSLHMTCLACLRTHVCVYACVWAK